MAPKTEEQLLEEITTLKKEVGRLQTLSNNEEKYRSFFEQSSDALVIIDGKNGDIVEFNDNAFKSLGYTRKEFSNLHVKDLGLLDSAAEKKNHMAQVHTNGLSAFETQHRGKDGTIKTFMTRSRPVIISDNQFFLSIWTDITEQKQAEKLLKDREKELEDTITTMKVLLKQRESDKLEIEESFLADLKKLVEPQLNKLNKICTSQDQKKYLEIIGSNLKEIGEKFSTRLTSKYLNLTPSEIQIANLIKHNRSSKEISETMNISISTVDFHRKNIRNKLNIKNTKTNLKSYLSAL